VTEDHSIRVQEIARCLLCQATGTPIYQGLRDRLFGAPGAWGFSRCVRCGFVWLNPQPTPEDMGRVYRNYYTHALPLGECNSVSRSEKLERAMCATVVGFDALATGMAWRQIGNVLALLPQFRDMGRLGTMGLGGVRKGRLLDVGCGNGRFLAWMREAGWEVMGLEWDSSAAEIARSRLGVPVVVGTLENAHLSDNSFNAITLHHVIEHVPDPMGLLRECRRLVSPKGRIVVATPNVESRGHGILGAAWRGLEPPRHLHLFSLATLRTCCDRAKIKTLELRTSSRSAVFIWLASQECKTNQSRARAPIQFLRKLRGYAFQVREELERHKSAEAGEELFMIGTPGD
jgi:2-polyprenyl-3-methyl-5-hydroxy-6-metoxy-1,4-benzoquinol methylase